MINSLERLPLGEVHVWSALAEKADIFQEILSADEEERAERLRTTPARNSFVTGRGMVRLVAGFYCQRDPAAIRFQFGPHGKPALDPMFEDIRFNIAHSDGIVLCAFARGCDVGVDLEAVRERRNLLDVAIRFFSSREAAFLGSLPAAEFTAAFYRIWARKEAILKATGRGIGGGLRFEVPVAAGSSEYHELATNSLAKERCWSLIDLKVADDFYAAVAVEGRGFKLRQFVWPDGLGKA